MYIYCVYPVMPKSSICPRKAETIIALIALNCVRGYTDVNFFFIVALPAIASRTALLRP